ncbi:MAG: SMP-30/gluconolactonase/LRE family protein [Kofleriaceae bacterium]
MGRHIAKLILGVVAFAGCVEEPSDCETCVERPPSTVFLSDRGNDTILRYDGRTGGFEGVFAQGRASRIDRPASLRLGPSGYAYLAGFGIGDVVRYDVASGAMKDVFYWDTRLLEEPLEIAFRGEEVLVMGNDTGNVVVLDAHGDALREIGYMRNALDMVLAADQRTLYVGVETDTAAIQVWDVDTGLLVREMGTPSELASGTSLALAKDGSLYACDWQREQILRFDAQTGALIDTVVAPGALRVPVAIDFGPDGALYALDEDGLHRMDPETGLELQLLVAARDGHNVRPRAFTFMTETAIAQAIARTR